MEEMPERPYAPFKVGVWELLVEENYDLSRREVVEELVEVGRANVKELRAIHKELGKFIRTHCSLNDLLSPT